MLLPPDVFRRLCRSRELLREVRERPLAITDIAREAGMSPFHFIRRFDALFGETPHQFRIRSRLEHAKMLLAADTHSITDVCMEVGMDSLGSFSDLFARRVGITPSAYRQSARCKVWAIGCLPQELFPGCLSLMGRLPSSAFRNFQEASIDSASLQSGGVVHGGMNANQINQHHR
jgi:AraC-like DNA-binding protein